MKKEAVKVLFASGSEDLIPTAIEHMRAIFPELPLEVVSEFPAEGAIWVPYNLRRGVRENLARCRAHFHGKQIRISAVILQPRMPYWRMRLVAFLLAPWNFLAFNEGFGHFMLRPRSLPTIVRHMLWRTRNLFVWELSPGGATYTLFWRLAHPWAFRRPLLAMLARFAGVAAVAIQRAAPYRALAHAAAPMPEGVSVVVPSRNGKDLLARFLPEILRQVAGEVIVVDNGSDDGTAAFLRARYPEIIVIEKPAPLSFARAVNLGIRAARFSHVCLLNNDMEIGENFFTALRGAIDRIPNLFCATAQIFFPPGARREETGKAVMPPQRKPSDFPVRCNEPIEGEDLSYVLYGSGGCSLFASEKLRQLGGLDEIFEPAYVEDLDLGVRGWQQGWPTVFVADARVVHMHRATTSRYYSPQELDTALELNYLRFLARTMLDRTPWREAIRRLNLLAAKQTPDPAAARALSLAWRVPFLIERRPRPMVSNEHIRAIGSGLVSVFPGRSSLPSHLTLDNPRGAVPPDRAGRPRPAGLATGHPHGVDQARAGARAAGESARPTRFVNCGKPVVLVASPYLPFPLSHGGAVRMYNLMRRAARDFDQVLVSFVDEARPVPVEVLDICVEVVTVERSGSHLLPSTGRPDVVEEFDSPAFHAALRQTVAKWNPGVAQLEFTQMAQYAADCAPARTILVEHDVTLDLYQQLLAQGEDWELRHQLERWIPFETEAWRRVDRVVAMSEKDRTTIAGGRTVCLPNGVDLERFRPSTTRSEPRRVLFIGSFAHLPNVLAVEFFLREVWPLLENSTLHIIAGARHQYFLDRYRDRAQVDLHRPGIEVEDFVSDVRPAYERAAVVVAPLLASAGTNIKIMEAMAMGKAIVSTSAGINGLDLEAGHDIIVADSGPEMARAIRELFEDPSRRASLEKRARETVERRFDWDAIAGLQKRLYEELAGLTRE